MQSALLAASASLLLCSSAEAKKLPLERIKLPPGFSIEVWADNVPSARSLALGAQGTVFVGSRSDSGAVYAIHDRSISVVAKGLRMPNGVAFKDGSLYVAELTRIVRFDQIESHLQDPPKPVVVYGELPKFEWHGWRYIAFGPDGLLYVGIGAPCNVCTVKDPLGTVSRLKPDGSGFEVFARGVRNSVGFDWQPSSKVLYFTDNGRDELGDDVPPDELNRAPKQDMSFGFPYCHGGEIPDPIYGKDKKCSELTPPLVKLHAHVAAIGMRFYTGSMFPAEYKDQIFIAEHGSWNRSVPIGYRIELVRLRGESAKSEVFAEGWLQGREAWGRPADVLVMPDGALLVSDDKAGAVYRINYRAKP
jgi:glucose/arabinose dehydrogenase